MVCGVRKEGETIMPFPAEVLDDLIEGDETHPFETPACGQIVQSLPQRHQTNLFAARQCCVHSTPALEVLDEVAA